MKKKLLRIWSGIRNWFKKLRIRMGNFVRRHPFSTFLTILGIVFVLIVVSNIIGNIKPKTEEQAVPVKTVQTYKVGSVPEITVQAHVEKSGVITITALTGGVVQKINNNVGDPFKRGEVLISLSSNYQGGNTSSLQRQLAQTQYNNAVATFDLQKEIIAKQRELAEKTDANADDLRGITDKSVSETRDLINLNRSMLATVDEALKTMEEGGSTDADMFETRSLKAQLMQGINSAEQGLRNAEYQASGDKPPAALSNLQKDIALKQLDTQEKMLEMNREVSRISVSIARANEAMMFPSAPFAGTVQRVFVKEGQAVNPGTQLMVIAQNIEDDPIVAVALVSADIARKVSDSEQAIIHIDGNTKYSTYPSYISQEAVNGTLHAIYFPIPDEFSPKVTETGFIQIDIPVGYADTTAFIPYVPIDAIYQTRDQNYLFVAENGVAVSRSVELGFVYGNHIEITSGLKDGDQIILDRTVVAGDKVTPLE